MPQPFKNAVLTNAGANIISRAKAGDGKIQFTRIVTGNGSYSEAEKDMSLLQAMSELKSEKNTFNPSSITRVDDTCVRISVLITNMDPRTKEAVITEAYYINEIGLYAKIEGDKSDVLYSVTVSVGEKGDLIPAYNGESPAQINQAWDTKVSSDAEIAFQLPAGAVAMASDLEGKVDKEDGKGLSSNDFTDGCKKQIDANLESIKQLSVKAQELIKELSALQEKLLSASASTSTHYPDKKDLIPTLAFLSYWNGAYNSSGNSNLTNCAKGAFGDIITKSISDFLSSGGGSLNGDIKFENTGDTAHTSRGIYGTVGTDDFWCVRGSQNKQDDGFLEIATSDGGNEPIFVRQYGSSTGNMPTESSNVAHQISLMNAQGNQDFNQVSASYYKPNFETQSNTKSNDTTGRIIGQDVNGSCNGMYTGNGDEGGENGKANLIFKSWYGIGFVDACTNAGMTIGFNVRNGNIKHSTLNLTSDGNSQMKYAGNSSTILGFLNGSQSGVIKPSTATGWSSLAGGYGSHAEGDVSFAFGQSCTASGTEAVAMGYSCTASGEDAVALCRSNVASGKYAKALGCGSTASGIASVALCRDGVAAGQDATALGYGTVANANYTIAGGYRTSADSYAMTALGTCNKVDTSNTGYIGAGNYPYLVVGNGTETARSNAMRMQANGNMYVSASYNSNGADYAEFMEWADGNKDSEDRVGYFVTYDDTDPEKIRIASEGDDIVGVVSATASVIGNSDEDYRKRYITDDFGRVLMEEKEVEVQSIDADGNEIKEAHMALVPKENPIYDASQAYISRAERQEWDVIGMLGFVYVHEDGSCKVGGYCKCTNGGIATTADAGYKVIKRVSDSVVKIAIR